MPLLRPNKPVQIPMPVPQQQYKPPFLEIDERRGIMKSDFQEYPERMNWKDIAYFLADPAYGPTRQQPVADSLKAMGNRGDEYGIWRYIDYLGKNKNLPIEGKPYSDDFYKGLIHTQPEEEQDSTKVKQRGGQLEPEILSKWKGDESFTRTINKYANQPNDTTYTSMKPGNLFYHNTGQNLPGGKPLTNMSVNRQPVDITTVQPKNIQDSIARIKAGLGLLKSGGIVKAQIGTKLRKVWDNVKEDFREEYSPNHRMTPEDLEAATNMAIGSAGALKNVTVGVGREVAALNSFLKNRKPAKLMNSLGRETAVPIKNRADIVTTPLSKATRQTQANLEVNDAIGNMFRKIDETGLEPPKFDFDNLSRLLKANLKTKKPSSFLPGLNRPGMNQDGGVIQRQSFDTM